MTSVFYPRAVVDITARVAGETLSTKVIPSRVSHTRRSHSQADTCEVEIHGGAMPFDPRSVESCFIQVFIGSVPSMNDRVDLPRYLRFVGYVDKLSPELSKDKAPVVKLEARDLSASLRDRKVIADARNRITGRDIVNTALFKLVNEAYGDGAELPEVPDSELSRRAIATVLPARARAAPLQFKAGSSLWEKAEHFCGLLALRPKMNLTSLDVLAASDTFTLGEPAATFVYGASGANLTSVRGEKQFHRATKGILVVSYDSVENRRLEAKWPPDAELRARQPVRAGRTRRAPPPPEREILVAQEGVTQATLNEIARETYEERSRQEVEYSLDCPVPTEEALALKNGDRIRLAIRPDLAAEVRGTRDEDAAIRVLRLRLGCSTEAAAALVRVSRNPLLDRYYVRSATTEWNATSACTVKAEVINLIVADAAPVRT